MTITNTEIKKIYIGDGILKTWSYPYTLFKDEHLVVLRVDTATTPWSVVTLTLTTDYTISGDKDEQEVYRAGVDVALTAAQSTPAITEKIVIYNDPTRDQQFDHQENEGFLAEAVENVYDKLTVIMQRISERLDRAVSFDESAPEIGMLMPTVSGKSGQFLRTNVAEDAFEWFDVYTAGALAVSAFVETLLDDADSDEFLQTLSAKLRAIHNLTWSANQMVQLTGVNTLAVKPTADFGQLAVASAWSAAQAYSADVLSITTGAVDINFATNGIKTLSLTENVVVNAASNIAIDRCMILVVTQDSTGGRTLSFNVGYDFAGNDSEINAIANTKTVYWLYSPNGTTICALKIWEDD